MKQGRFEQQYRPLWDSLEQQLERLEALRTGKQHQDTPLSHFVGDYRQLCHQLALARERSYSLELQNYLNALVLRAHRQLYRYNPPLAERIGGFLARGFPQAVRRQWRWHLVSALCFLLSMGLVWVLVWQQPDMIYTVVDENTISNLEEMYQPEDSMNSISADRTGNDDVLMFGHYIQNNIGIAFRTFASGLLLGIGALFVMLFNGSFFGAAAAHLINVEGDQAFFTFVIAHGAPELTAIVLAGGAGLRLGWAIIAPGPWSRLDALRLAARDALPTMYGVFALLLLAAFIEAFWSPRDFEPAVKYSVGAACWGLLYLYLLFGGRHGAGKG